LRRALASLDFAVLAVDERGFGASPPPPDVYDLENWDPEPTSLAAARYLESMPEVEGSVFAVGHSMGATRVLRFIDRWQGASAGVILGATVMPPADDDERLYGRFLDDFDVEESGLTRPFVLSVRRRYFNNDAAAGALFDGHAPILFLRFTFDYENIIAGRDLLFEMIPGGKVGWELRSDHQFASTRVGGVIGGDWRVMRRLQVGLARFVEGRDPGSGAPLRFAPRR
jgi:pimeloyl-ACP methyl ester carboxylesterase